MAGQGSGDWHGSGAQGWQHRAPNPRGSQQSEAHQESSSASGHAQSAHAERTPRTRMHGSAGRHRGSSNITAKPNINLHGPYCTWPSRQELFFDFDKFTHRWGEYQMSKILRGDFSTPELAKTWERAVEAVHISQNYQRSKYFETSKWLSYRLRHGSDLLNEFGQLGLPVRHAGGQATGESAHA